MCLVGQQIDDCAVRGDRRYYWAALGGREIQARERLQGGLALLAEGRAHARGRIALGFTPTRSRQARTAVTAPMSASIDCSAADRAPHRSARARRR